MVALPLPSFSEERTLLAQGFSLIAGVDEAGCGAWAGPVYAGAVILPFNSRIGLVRDSKTLSADQREEVAVLIKQRATAWAVGSATSEEIASLNIRRASALAMRRAVEALSVTPQFLLVDAFSVPGGLPQKGIIDGDRKVKCIAAASVLAKVARDAHMRELDAAHPGYGFALHKGYGTVMHQKALAELGPCAIHRTSYAPIKKFLAVPQIV